MNYVQTKETDYVRDLGTHALLNRNTSALSERKARKNHERRIEKLEKSMEEIKQLTQTILDLIRETRT